MPAIRFSFFGVPVEFRASFLLIVVIIGLPGHLAPELMLGWIAIATLAVFVHEAGHAMAFIAYGDRPSITLHGAGGHTVGSNHGARRMIVVSAAGPLAGILLGLVVLLVARHAPAEGTLRLLVDDALFATFGLSVLNLLPLGTFDGAGVLNALLSLVLGRPPGAAGWVVGALSIAALIAGAVLLGHPEIAVPLMIVVGFMVIETRSIVDPFGRPEQRRSATSLLSHGRSAEALAVAEAELRAHPNSVEAALNVGGALSRLTRWGEAESVYSSVLERDADNQLALAARSVARRALGRPVDADADLNRLLANPPSDIHATSAQFFGLYSADRYEAALALVRSELAKPDIPIGETHHLLALEAILLSILGEPEAALARADSLASLRPDDFTLHELLALALLQLGRVEAAAERARRALAGAPNHPELMETLGIAERLGGDPEKAFRHLLDAATARPELPRARAELAACFTQLGRHEEAAAALESLPEWASHDPFVLYARACAFAAAGDADEAGVRLEKAARIRPSLGQIARHDPLLRPLFDSKPLAAPQPVAAS